MKVIVDRIEKDYVVVEIEKGKMCNLPVDLVPNVKEGDVINITVDKKETKKRKEQVIDLMSSLFE